MPFVRVSNGGTTTISSQSFSSVRLNAYQTYTFSFTNIKLITYFAGTMTWTSQYTFSGYRSTTTNITYTASDAAIQLISYTDNSVTIKNNYYEACTVKISAYGLV